MTANLTKIHPLMGILANLWSAAVDGALDREADKLSEAGYLNYKSYSLNASATEILALFDES